MRKRTLFLLLAATSFAVPACSTDPTTGPGGGGDDVPGDDVPGGPQDEWDRELQKREYDYNAALKIAALRLTGDLPTMAEISSISSLAGNLAGQKQAYETLLADYMSRPTYARQMVSFWKDTFKMGDTAELDFAPTFAAKLSVENGNYMDLLTASSGACPTYNAGDGTFAAGDCQGAGPKVGVLTDRGMNRHYFGNFAFRRVKWVQETFDCLKFPTEIGNAPQDVGGPTPYTGSWPFTSISGTSNGGRVDFLDVSAVICANCHQTLNHIAPLFANFDMNGAYQTNIAVPTPLDGAPLAQLADYLPPGETTAWRYGVPAADLAGLGGAMAADPNVAKCGVARIWNWAMGKQDIVDALMEVPAATIQAQVDAFTSSGFKMKDLIFAVYSADDFVKF